jgi:hypothetical protein
VCLIDCTGALGNIYGNVYQTCHLKGKTYRDAQLGEPARFIVVDHVSEHGVICRSEPAEEKRGEGELLLDNSHLEPQAVRAQHHHGDDDSE